MGSTSTKRSSFTRKSGSVVAQSRSRCWNQPGVSASGGCELRSPWSFSSSRAIWGSSRSRTAITYHCQLYLSDGPARRIKGIRFAARSRYDAYVPARARKEAQMPETRAIPVRRLNHAVLYVRDLDRSAGFYTRIFGFEEVAREAGMMAFMRATA